MLLIKLLNCSFIPIHHPVYLIQESVKNFLVKKLLLQNADGRIEFQANISNAEVDIANGHSVSATATDVNGNTSEFSASIVTAV